MVAVTPFTFTVNGAFAANPCTVVDTDVPTGPDVGVKPDTVDVKENVAVALSPAESDAVTVWLPCALAGTVKVADHEPFAATVCVAITTAPLEPKVTFPFATDAPAV
jgi:hypothetical protein